MSVYPDPYWGESLKGFVYAPVDSLTGANVKRFAQLGDRVAATILVNVPQEHRSQSEVAKRIARILLVALDNPNSSGHIDGLPYLSIYLLESLIPQVEDAQVREKLDHALHRLVEIRNEFLEKHLDHE